MGSPKVYAVVVGVRRRWYMPSHPTSTPCSPLVGRSRQVPAAEHGRQVCRRRPSTQILSPSSCKRWVAAGRSMGDVASHEGNQLAESMSPTQPPKRHQRCPAHTHQSLCTPSDGPSTAHTAPRQPRKHIARTTRAPPEHHAMRLAPPRGRLPTGFLEAGTPWPFYKVGRG